MTHPPFVQVFAATSPFHLWLTFFAVLPYMARQLTMLTTLMAKKAIPQQLGEILNDFSAAFLPIAQAESCEFEALERQMAAVRP